MSSTVKTAILWFVVVVGVFLLWSLFQTTKGTAEAISYTTFLERVDAGAVERVVIRGSEVRGTTRPTAPGGRYDFHVTIAPNYPYTYDALRTHGVIIEFEPTNDAPLMTALISWAPILFLIGLWIFFMRGLRRRAEPAEPKQ